MVNVDNRIIIYYRSNSIPNITYTFEITSVYPSTGSILGGNTITISGVGFSGNVSDYMAMIGNNECVVIDATDVELRCIVPSVAETYLIENTGTHACMFIFYYF